MENIIGIALIIGGFTLGLYLMWLDINKKKKEKLEEKLRKEKENINKQKEIERKSTAVKAKLEKADVLGNQLSEIQEVEIPDISEFKQLIVDNEKAINEKGGDKQLFSFMKIDSFLRDYRGRIISDQSGLKEVLDFEWLKSRIQSEGQRADLDKIIENLEDSSARLEGGKARGFDSNVDNLFRLGEVMKPTMENQIKTMVFYKNMAAAMVIFYLNDKKIRYFEIYEAFEKLGVFDSTWQKNVLNKLDSIEIRLSQISNQLTDLNQNFISLVESSENVVSELKEINSNIISNNMLQAITAYQTWRINKNTKTLRS
jgi:DNA repair exonuclease SbcCD ATPase subunit